MDMLALAGTRKNFSITTNVVAVVAVLILSMSWVTRLAAGTTFSLDQRMACQTVIEDIRWSHRIWPPENNSTKPQRSEILSDQQVREKVEDSLRMEAALAGVYGVDINDALLQAELDRMTGSTKAPVRLQELFDALDNDPVAIAECLARPTLVRKQLYDRYVQDDSQFADLRLQAETALAVNDDPVTLTASGAREGLLKFVRVEGNQPDTNADDTEDGYQLYEIVDDEFDYLINRFSTVPDLRETEIAFVYEKVLSQAGDILEIHRFIWQKQSFDEWWRLQADKWSIEEASPVSAMAMVLGPITGATPEVGLLNSEPVSADRWKIYSSQPSERYEHTAVWTGSEMIVWGGKTLPSYYPTNTGGRYDPVTDSWANTSNGNVDDRSLHTAVWTGMEMIVWGGVESSGVLDSGGRYNPASDSWSIMTTTGAPSARDAHTAVWTGTEMIIWGGSANNSGTETNSGGRYDPETDTWSATGTGTGVPDVRHEHTAVWTGSKMIVWGGRHDDNDVHTTLYYASGGMYDPETDTWMATNTSGAPDGRYRHTMIWSGTEMIVWGGTYYLDHTTYVTNTGGRYNPSTNSWTSTSLTNVPAVRESHTAVWSGTEMIVWGGREYSPYYTSGGWYNPTTNSWIATEETGAPTGRYGHVAIWSDSEMIIWGGRGSTLLDTGGRFNPGTDSWTATAISMAPDGYINHHAIWTGSEMIVWGGTYNSTLSNTGGVYDPLLNVWVATSMTGVPVVRAGETAIWTGSEMIIWGGGTSFSSCYADGARYNPGRDLWTAITTAGAPTARYGHTAVWTGSKMIVWGGYEPAGYYPNTGGMYDPVADSWQATGTDGAPVGRNGRTAVWTGTEMIVWGGSQFNGVTTDYYNTGGRYNPETNIWATTTLSNAPVGRQYHSAIWTGSEMIIWGGRGVESIPLGSGGRYYPSTDTWTSIATSGAPEGYVEHSAVWTGSEVIIWGGSDGDTYSNSGGRYSPAGDSWAATTAVGAPAASIYHNVVWTGNAMIVWGLDRDSNDTCIYYPYSTHTIGGSVTGLGVAESIVLQNNGGDDLVMDADGTFTFTRTLVDGSSYDVTVSSQPATAGRYCGIPVGSGTLSGADFTEIEVNCVSISLRNVIAALQVLSGMNPTIGELTSLVNIAPDGRISLAEAIMVLSELATP